MSSAVNRCRLFFVFEVSKALFRWIFAMQRYATFNDCIVLISDSSHQTHHDQGLCFHLPAVPLGNQCLCYYLLYEVLSRNYKDGSLFW